MLDILNFFSQRLKLGKKKIPIIKAELNQDSLLLNFSDELLLKILRYLSMKDLVLSQSVCERLKNLAVDDTLWKEIAAEVGMPTSWRVDIEPVKLRLIEFFNECLKIKQEHSQEFIDMCGGLEALAAVPALPILKSGFLRRKSYFESEGLLSPEQLVTHKVMRGIDVQKDCNGKEIKTPFLAFCFKKNGDFKIPQLEVEIIGMKDNSIRFMRYQKMGGKYHRSCQWNSFAESMSNEYKELLKTKTDTISGKKLTDQTEFITDKKSVRKWR